MFAPPEQSIVVIKSKTMSSNTHGLDVYARTRVSQEQVDLANTPIIWMMCALKGY
jgi:hypothetical protein